MNLSHRGYRSASTFSPPVRSLNAGAAGVLDEYTAATLHQTMLRTVMPEQFPEAG